MDMVFKMSFFDQIIKNDQESLLILLSELNNNTKHNIQQLTTNVINCE